MSDPGGNSTTVLRCRGCDTEITTAGGIGETASCAIAHGWVLQRRADQAVDGRGALVAIYEAWHAWCPHCPVPAENA